MSDFEQYLAHCLDELTPSRVKDAMQYSLMAKGKRVRPHVLFKALEAYGFKETIGFACASAIEMVHTYSLIHDDLPAMDNDTLRRGKPTCHVQFDEATAILAGDGLLTQAFLQATKACEDPMINHNIISYLASYAGADGMILGQIRDILGEQKQLSLNELQEIHIYKTGKLLTLPLICAALLTNHEEDIPQWIKIGTLLGLSFQIQDDVLDEISTVEELGKNIHSDLRNEKTTYITLLGIEGAQKEVTRYYEEAIHLLQAMKLNPEPIETYMYSLIHRKN